ncbi:MAG: hypothetical protein KBT79_15785, partial [Thalassolituus oleivorans]|nr:hypothetical protein [Thalassolituus oleivorans]
QCFMKSYNDDVLHNLSLMALSVAILTITRRHDKPDTGKKRQYARLFGFTLIGSNTHAATH